MTTLLNAHDRTFLSHRVYDDASSAFWYPLHHLTRWSGMVGADADLNQVKRAMAEAKAYIHTQCQHTNQSLTSVYKKIGPIVCVSEEGFVWSLESWSKSQQNLDEGFLTKFGTIREEIFRNKTSNKDERKEDGKKEEDGVVGNEKFDHPHVGGEDEKFDEKKVAILMHKYAPSTTTMTPRTIARDGGNEDDHKDIIDIPTILPSASLSSDDSIFSLASALDQHLQPRNNPHSNYAASSSSSSVSSSTPLTFDGLVSSSQIDLKLLTRIWSSEFSHARLTNPQLVSEQIERICMYQQRLSELQRRHHDIQVQLDEHHLLSKPLYEKLTILQTNMSFLTHVQTYEQLFRTVMDLTEKCREELAIMDQTGTNTNAISPINRNGNVITQQPSLPPPSSSSSSTNAPHHPPQLDSTHIQNVCVMFLKLLRLYRMIQESVSPPPPLPRSSSSLPVDVDSSSSSSTSWSGLPHLHQLIRQRILSILQPLRTKLVQLYQQTLIAIHWPQTTNSLLMGLTTIQTSNNKTGAPGATSTSSNAIGSPSSSVGGSPSPSPTSANDGGVGVGVNSGGVSSALSLFQILTENLIRVQMLLVECGMTDEIRMIEKEFKGIKTTTKEKSNEHNNNNNRRSNNTSTTTTTPTTTVGTKLWILTALIQPIYKRFYYHFDSSTGLIGDPSIVDPTGTSTSVGSSTGVGGGVPSSNTPTMSSSSSSSNVPSSSSSSSSSSSTSQSPLTNRLDKPEWVCTFLEKMFIDHKEFLHRYVQPIINSCQWRKEYEQQQQQQVQGNNDTKRFDSISSSSSSSSSFEPYDVTLEFLERLLMMYHTKLSRTSTLHLLCSDGPLLSHTLNELISFERKLHLLYEYPIYSSKHCTLLEPFLLEPTCFQRWLKLEKDRTNLGLDELRNLKRPWEDLRNGEEDGDSECDDDDDEDDGTYGNHADQPHDMNIDSNDDPSASLLHSTSSATHSSFEFLSLVDRLTTTYKSFKYLNHRLILLKDLQFKLFEIYEEDLIREFQENWKGMIRNVKRGGLKYLRWEKNLRKKKKNSETKHGDSMNPLHLWRTHCGMLNSIYYITTILKGWNEEFVFLELFYFYTHKSKIQASFLQANKSEVHNQVRTFSSSSSSSSSSSLVELTHPATSIGGIVVKSTNLEGGVDEEVYITSEELARWIGLGGKIETISNKNDTTETSMPSTSTSNSNDGTMPSSLDAALPSSLPADFAATMSQLAALQSLHSQRGSGGGAGGVSIVDGSSTETFSHSTTTILSSTNSDMNNFTTPTSENLFPKLHSSSNDPSMLMKNRSNYGGPISSPGGPTSSTSLPFDLTLSGTLFQPILTSYISLHDEMMSSLIQIIVTHFRDSIRTYSKEGHMMRGDDGGEGVDGSDRMIGSFFREPSTTTTTTTMMMIDGHDTTNTFVHLPNQHDWDRLDSTLDISSSLCEPLLDLKMELLVVHRSLTRPLHRTFFTTLAMKLSQILYEDLIVGQYFTRSGSLQFIRDMRAIFVIFEAYMGGNTATSSSSSRRRNRCFNLIHDALNILLLSSSQLHQLDLQLTVGPIASGSSTTIRQFLSSEPYDIHRMTMQQVIQLIAHMRVEREDMRREERQQQQQQQQQHDAADDEEQQDEGDDEEFVHDESSPLADVDDGDGDGVLDDVGSDVGLDGAGVDDDDGADDVADDRSPDAALAPPGPPREKEADVDAEEEEEFEEPNMDEFEGFPEAEDEELEEDEINLM